MSYLEETEDLNAYERKLLAMPLTEIQAAYQRHVGRLMIGKSGSAPVLIRAIIDKLRQQGSNSNCGERSA
jgi:hypothetical protein